MTNLSTDSTLSSHKLIISVCRTFCTLVAEDLLLQKVDERPLNESGVVQLETTVKTGAVENKEKAAIDTIHEDAAVKEAAQGSG